MTSRARVTLVSTCVLLATSCGGDRAAPGPRTEEPASLVEAGAPTGNAFVDDADDPKVRDDGRLPRGAVPERYTLAFRVTPADDRFSGTARIDVRLDAPSRAIVLHGSGLRVTRVSAWTGAREVFGGSHTRAAFGASTREELVLTFAEPLPAGKATLVIEYDAPFDRARSGLYRIEDKEHFYAFTELEPTYARRVFPCFDEPSWKTPFDVSIRAPWGLLAVANTKEIDRVADGDGNVFRFATTKPLPTYLIAFAVGDLEVREGATSPVPIRAITVRGKKELSSLALETTQRLLATLTDYVGVPYPYDKLDVVAVPELSAAAMENAGFITFREELLLVSGAATRGQKRAQAQLVAHELAHQWFGDLVTAAWWDDLFLNEGFATWLSDVATDRAYPAYGARLESELDLASTFDLDALATTRAVRQPARTEAEILEAFDDITYDKGGTLLEMLEAYVGRETFQRGIHDYLTRYAYRTAETRDLIASIESASGRSLSPIIVPLTTRAGVPWVHASVTCQKSPPRTTMTFSLAEWLAQGEAARDAPSWTVPVCYQTAKTQGCVELDATHPVTREEPGACAAWVNPSRDHGYYRYTLPPAGFLALASPRALRLLDARSRVELASNAWAAVRAGELPVPTLFELLPAFDDDHERHVTQAVIAVLSQLSEVAVALAARPAFEAFVRARLSGHARYYGSKRKPSDDEAVGKRAVDAALATLGNDPQAAARMEALTRAWLRDHGAVDQELAQVAVETSSRSAGSPRFAELARAMTLAKEPLDRLVAVVGLGAFDDPALLDKALDMAIAGEMKAQDIDYILRAALGRRTARTHVAEYVMAHWDALARRLPEEQRGALVRVMGTACTRADVARYAELIEPRVRETRGAERAFRAYAERAKQCVALRERAEPDVLTALRKTSRR